MKGDFHKLWTVSFSLATLAFNNLQGSIHMVYSSITLMCSQGSFRYYFLNSHLFYLAKKMAKAGVGVGDGCIAHFYFKGKAAKDKKACMLFAFYFQRVGKADCTWILGSVVLTPQTGSRLVQGMQGELSVWWFLRLSHIPPTHHKRGGVKRLTKIICRWLSKDYLFAWKKRAVVRCNILGALNLKVNFKWGPASSSKACKCE